MKTYTLRLHSGEDPLTSLDTFGIQHQMEAATLLSCVGSLRKAVLRFANKELSTTLHGKFEIVSLTGVFSMHGSHYHIAISDGEGRTYGAHLLEGSEVFTTMEVVLASLDDVRFLRTLNPQTGYPKLDIQPIS
jgi:predicted DNA-binding protein with PD1-like motif